MAHKTSFAPPPQNPLLLPSTTRCAWRRTPLRSLRAPPASAMVRGRHQDPEATPSRQLEISRAFRRRRTEELRSLREQVARSEQEHRRLLQQNAELRAAMERQRQHRSGSLTEEGYLPSGALPNQGNEREFQLAEQPCRRCEALQAQLDQVRQSLSLASDTQRAGQLTRQQQQQQQENEVLYQQQPDSGGRPSIVYHPSSSSSSSSIASLSTTSNVAAHSTAMMAAFTTAITPPTPPHHLQSHHHPQTPLHSPHAHPLPSPPLTTDAMLLHMWATNMRTGSLDANVNRDANVAAGYIHYDEHGNITVHSHPAR